MIVKAVTLFLIGIGVLAMFGRLRAPRIGNPLGKSTLKKNRKCKKCGSYILGSGPCACSHRKK